MLCRRCRCDEYEHTIKVGWCRACGYRNCSQFVPETQTCPDCGVSISTHTSQSDCLKALRERIEALEATRGTQA